MKCMDNKRGIFTITGFTLAAAFSLILLGYINSDGADNTSTNTQNLPV